MSTSNKIDPQTAAREISRIRAAAVTLSSGSRVQHNPTMDELYRMSMEQPTCIVTDVPMADPGHVGLSPDHDRVLVSFTGQDTARSAWARLLTPQAAEIEKHPELLDTKDRIERLVREVNFHMMQNDIVHTEVYFGRNTEFMGKIHFLVPRKYAKLAFDLNLNFVRPSPETDALYRASKRLKIPDIWLVCQPDWVNPSWQAWRHRVAPTDNKRVARDPEPKRIMMVFDTQNYTAYLLGARYFGEAKKACLTMIWDAAIKSGIGMPIHGSSKTLYIHPSTIEEQNETTSAAKADEQTEKDPARKTKNNKEEEVEPTTFITIGLSGSGKSTIGNHPHHEMLDATLGEHTRVGNDDALVVLYENGEGAKGTIGLENGCYNKSNDYLPGSAYARTVQSAENVMVTRDDRGHCFIIHEDVLNGNGRVQTARHMLEGADLDLDTPAPNYLCLLMKDETLPPLMRLHDPQLMVSMYMCLASRSTSAENIPIDQMGKLRMIPGANPFNTWGMQHEAESLEKLFNAVGCEGLILNTGGFFIDAEHNERGETRKVPKELSLSIYPLIARNQIKWVDWEQLPGTQIPAPGSFDMIEPDYDALFNPTKLEDGHRYCELLRERLFERLRFLMQIKIDRRYALPLRKAIYQLDAHDLETRRVESDVDNLDTLLGTGRDIVSLN